MTSTLPPLDLNNVQGDILAGLPKKTQTYFFFLIDDSRVHHFRTQLAHLIPLITTTAEVLGHHKTISQVKGVAAQHGVPLPLLKISGVNVVFSHKGLSKMGIDDSKINDKLFVEGMLAHAVDTLGDPETTANPKSPDWVPAFKHGVDGMVLVSGDSHATVAEKLAEIEKIFFVGTPSATIHEALRIVGDVRPGNEKGHEHFGFKDGISQPAIQGVDPTNNPGQEFVPPGVTILGREGDDETTGGTPIPRPSWAVDGSFLAFRYLFQLVPEFNTFLKKNPIVGPAPDLGSELLGARLVGRWKSGAPVDLAPTHDNPAMGNDNSRNNNFSYDFPDDPHTQDRCPYAAHTRKTNPRADLEKAKAPFGPDKTTNNRIIRRGIQFGPEVSAAEAASGKTTQGRGLLFAAYQSNISNGFQFIQQSWANNPDFIFNKVPNPGFDPIIGSNGAKPRSMVGTNPASQSTSLPLPTWVVPKGGEYFFSPSLSALKTTFALA